MKLLKIVLALSIVVVIFLAGCTTNTPTPTSTGTPTIHFGATATVTNTVTLPPVTVPPITVNLTTVQTLPPVTVYTTSPTVTIFTVAPTPTATTPPTTVIPPTIDNSISLSASNALNGTSGGTMSLRVGDTTAHIYVELFLTNTSSITISGVKVNLSVNWQTSIVYTTPTITNTVGSANWIYNSGTFTTLPAIAVPPSGLHFVLDLSYTFPALTAANSSAYLISGYKYG